MDAISLGKATQALNKIQDLDRNVVAPLAESRFPTVDARLDWLEGQASRIKVAGSKQVDLTIGTLTDVMPANGSLILKQVGTTIADKNGNLVLNNTGATPPAPYQVFSNAPNGWDTFRSDAIYYGHTNTPYFTLDFGAGNGKIVNKLIIDGSMYSLSPYAYALKMFKFYGSNDNVSFDLLYSGDQDQAANTTHTFTNENNYRYYKLEALTGYGGSQQFGIKNFEMWGKDVIPTYVAAGTWDSDIIDLGEGWIKTNLMDVVKVDDTGTVNITPTMTSDTAPSPYKVIQNGVAYASFPAWQVFNDAKQQWAGAKSNAFVGLDFVDQKKVYKYSVQVPSYMMGGGTDSYPKTFRLEGSNDNSVWEILDSQTNVPKWGIGETRTYTVTTPKNFRYYRVFVVTNWRDGYYETQINKIKFYEKSNKTVATLEVASSDDGVSFTGYTEFDPTALPSARFMKLRASLTAQAAPPAPVTLDFNQGDAQNTFDLKQDATADGTLRLKTSYSGTMNLDGATATGSVLSYAINKSQFKSIEKIEVK